MNIGEYLCQQFRQVEGMERAYWCSVVSGLLPLPPSSVSCGPAMAAVDPAALAVSLQMQQPRVNASAASGNDSDRWPPGELLYRHTAAMTALYCIAYLSVFVVGLVGNCFVVAVVVRSPRMRTVTNYFIVNLALADILVIVFCLPATLMSNIYVREYTFFVSQYTLLVFVFLRVRF
ncbi:hypothetical protein B566_EDAN005015 [Ephemera danica]|nr:hypothetical protein B566_EDAN005015 [Ephemera danica]